MYTAYHKLWSTSTGTSIRRLCTLVAQTMWGTYNHGLLFNEVKHMVVQQHAHETCSFGFDGHFCVFLTSLVLHVSGLSLH